MCVSHGDIIEYFSTIGSSTSHQAGVILAGRNKLVVRNLYHGGIANVKIGLARNVRMSLSEAIEFSQKQYTPGSLVQYVKLSTTKETVVYGTVLGNDGNFCKVLSENNTIERVDYFYLVRVY